MRIASVLYILINNAEIGDNVQATDVEITFVEYLLKDKKPTSFNERDRFLFHDD